MRETDGEAAHVISVVYNKQITFFYGAWWSNDQSALHV